MFKLKHFSYFLLFIICGNTTSLFPGLLPENIVYLSHNKFCKVKDLKPGKQITSIDASADHSGPTQSEITGIKVTRNFLDEGVLIVLETEEEEISSILVGSHQRFCVLKNHGEWAWVEAERLKDGLRLCGYGDKSLRVKDVQRIKLEQKNDLYEISLDNPHTFYLADSNGNRILTHNILGLFGWFVLGGAVVGALCGGGYAAYKAYKKDVVSAGTIAKGAVIGAFFGASAVAITYAGIYFGAKYLPVILSKLATYGMKSKTLKPLVEAIKKDPERARFIGGQALALVGGIFTFVGIPMIDNLINETERRENEDIDFSEVDHDDDEAPVRPLFEGTVRDRNGRESRIIIM